MDWVSALLPDRVVGSLGWTLLHSLWQGVVITVTGFLLLAFFKKGSASLRYLIGIGMLILMILVSLATFVMVHQNILEANALGISPVVTVSGRPDSGTGGFLASLKNHLNRNLSAVVTLWLMGMLLFSLRFVSGILINQRWRRHQTREVSRYWRNRLSGIARKMNIRPVVRFRESLVIGVPLTIGYFKPLILFPVGMLGRIPADQVEALIVHELAHILRRDYIANVLQNIVDIIYFYHPGIRWISHRVRVERENCCDDITVDQTGDSLTYARALTRAGELSLDYRDGLSMAASRDSSKLFMRIRRLLPMKKQRLKTRTGFLGLVCMMVLAGSLVLGVNASHWLFAGPGKVSGGSAVKTEDPDKDDVKRLMERHGQLAARKSTLTRKEMEEMEKIEAKLMAIKEMEEQKKLKNLEEELARLKAKIRRSEAEDRKIQKLTQFLDQYEIMERLEKMSRKTEELKNRERELSEMEKAELRGMEEKLKQHQMQARAEREEERRFLEQERKLKERELELKRMKLKEEYERLGQEIHRLNKKKKLTKKETDQLKRLKQKQEQIGQFLKTHTTD